MGSYYFSVLVFLLGAIKNVCGFSFTNNPDRIYENPKSPNFGKPMTVESDNVTTGSLMFENGAVGTFTMLSESAPQNHFYNNAVRDNYVREVTATTKRFSSNARYAIGDSYTF